MFKLIEILILLVYKTGDVHSAVVNFRIALQPSRIDFDCNYTFASYEKFDSLEISKDGQTFLQFAAGKEGCKYLILINQK